MADTERIDIGMEDEPTLIAEKLIDSNAENVIFAVPAGCQFSESLTNFKLIKREAQVLKKKIFIESTDERVLELAQKSGIEVHGGVEVPVDGDTDVVKVKITTPSKQRVTAPKTRRSAAVKEETVEVSSRGARKKKITVSPKPQGESEVNVDIDEKSEEEESEPREIIGEPVRPKRRARLSRRGWIWIAGAVAALALMLYLGLAVLPRASAELETEKTDWLYQQSVTVDKSVSVIDAAAARIPGQLFIQKETVVTKKPATGRDSVQRKAAGTITIYNEYSSKPQGLVATTRFITPGGVVYRLTKAVTVPGAHIENGTIVASSIAAPVAADKPGEEGNTGPVEKLFIPGFSGTPKFQKFYGELKDGASGGSTGETKVATAPDIETAKAEGLRAVEAALKNQAQAQIPEAFKVVDSATKFTLLKQEVNSVADADGNFSVSTQGQLSILGFREKDIFDVLHEKVRAEKGEQYQINTETLEYTVSTTPSANPLLGKLSLPIDYKAVLAQKIDVAKLKQQMQGQSEDGIKAIVYALPGVKTGKISLWPFWVRRVPLDEGRITVVIK